MGLDLYLDQFQHYKNIGLEAYRGGRWPEARQALLKAAEHLYQMAGKSEGNLRVMRKANAKKLKEMALSIAATAKPVSADAEEQRSAGHFLLQERPAVRFADIAGLEEVKECLRLKLLYPLAHPQLAEQYGIATGGGILLYGPPGTGKTLIARAVAGEMAAAFFTVKPSDIMSKLVGEAEKNVAELFRAARQEPRAVLFIDEVESLVPSRRDEHSSVMQRVVPQILQELEGLTTPTSSNLLFIGATNEPWSLDAAILRPGRFDQLLYLGLPDLPARQQIFALQLQGKPLHHDVDFTRLAEASDGYSGADIAGICRRVAELAFLCAIQEEEPKLIDLTLLLRTLEATAPSVTEVAQYEKFAQRR